MLSVVVTLGRLFLFSKKDLALPGFEPTTLGLSEEFLIQGSWTFVTKSLQSPVSICDAEIEQKISFLNKTKWYEFEKKTKKFSSNLFCN